MRCIARALAHAMAVGCLMAAWGTQAQAAAAQADRILVNGTVLTMDAGDTVAQAIAIRGERIVAVGANPQIRRLAGPATEVIDLGGRTVIPGLIDTHIHAIRGGQSYAFETYWYEGETTSLAAGLEQLRQTAQARGPGKWVAVTGSWHPDQFTEKRAPTPAELTALLPDNPAYVQYLYDYALVNAKAIEVLKLDQPDALPPGIRMERDSDGRLTGRIFGAIRPLSALFGRILAQSQVDPKASLQAFFGRLNSLGVTALIDPTAGPGAAYDPLFALWREDSLSLRVGYRIPTLVAGNEAEWFRNTLAFLPPRLGDGKLRFLGPGEMLVFGMDDGVKMGPGFQPSAKDREELLKVASFAASRGYPVEIHAYTDDAASAILDVFEEVGKRHDLGKLRWAMAHLNTGKPETFRRMKALGLAYTVQMGPYFEASAIGHANDHHVAEAAPPVRLALQHGLKVAGGTDATRIGIPGVWRALEFHVGGYSIGKEVRRKEDFRLSRLEALRLYTANAAWISFDETSRGTLEAGKLADLAVLDKPYLTVPVEDIHRIRSVLTMVDGKVVHGDGALAVRPALAPRAQRRQ
ncbi:amidohydrolase [Cupriavidus taiwanensis]|uniref:amidohydrolase n=1 Tax=Cupriavidus taiwanensis TaxID=164546 RepID=UPI000E1A0BF6|nr:amidohydrolase [Cupriavidus taiwanensis]SPC07020.1 putative Metallo-dependent hydrolase exported protein [Cupriavidus taiwanensis]